MGKIIGGYVAEAVSKRKGGLVIKHAYLILAHNEFEVLQTLISLIDDPRNDIYVHIDRKVKDLPVLSVLQSQLCILEHRVDVRWGSVSQIKAEYKLFEAAVLEGKGYDRYHLISGTHLPLKSQDDMHDFFRKRTGQEVLNFLYTNAYEINMKLARYHFFLDYFQYGERWQKVMANFCWHVLLKLQYILRIQKDVPKVSIKANNWVSLTDRAVQHILRHKEDVLTKFRWSLCGDEFFVPYLLTGKNKLFDIVDARNLLYNDFQGSNARVLTSDDEALLLHSDYLFARKFSKSATPIVDRIVQHLRDKP
ncbi:beta-1,6-N-acetylglucosaminyltransferase [Sphingobacterium griseoflavum]|uniref:Peptide O-xylosyltransferase n=1 Tax=Sphingobacterium griseoflavum TaxID=1474952 RepID=A0ABQ3HYA5_9SPHI|nr:beta-1,6-N-acetylglucosaminyltransferase [Sphingobacterium griseoflavum]GHE39774.1 glycosyl transferase [Sphingobacterium griseoflavum]